MPHRLLRGSFALQPLLLAAGFSILIGISAATAWLVNQSAEDARAVAHTLSVQDKLSNLLLAVRRAESGQRGYMLTQRRDYLEDFTQAAPAVPEIINELRQDMSDTLPRRIAVDLMENLSSSKMAELTRTIRLREAGSQEAAMAMVLTDEGRNLMEGLRKLVTETIQKEGAQLAERANRSQRNNILLLILTVTGALLILAIGGLSVYLMQKSLRQRERAREELAATNENLEQIVQHRTADLTEANEEIQRFAYIVSHDLRSPLVNIMGFTSELESLRQDIFAQVAALRSQVESLQTQAASDAAGSHNIDTLGKDFDEAIGFIKSSITKMDRLINAVLRLSREGRREFRPELVEMNALLKTIQASSTHQAFEQGATVTIGDLPNVRSDRLALEQVFSNLVDNALKYLRHGVPGEIEITGRETPLHVVYEVRDNGRGIDPADHQRIFELFRRSGAQDRPGEGIGLAHVRALVRRLGGTLRVESELGKGSVFTVTLPKHWNVEQDRSAA